MTNEDLVSRGSNECWGIYNTTTKKGWGGGYANNCIHSGTIRTSGDLPTAWYNYALASAGTIKNSDASDDTGSTEKATESICPKGWTLPNNIQLNSNRDTTIFSPVLGGGYESGGKLSNESTHGVWWGSLAFSSAARYSLRYYDNALDIGSSSGHSGLYIRCVPAP